MGIVIMKETDDGKSASKSAISPDIAFLNKYTTWHDVANTVDEDLEFASVVVDPGVEDGFHLVERGSFISGRKRFLCFFIHRHLCFRLPEFQGVAERLYGASTWRDGLPIAAWERPLDDMTRTAFWYVHLPDDGEGLALEMASRIVEACFLVRAILDPWADGGTLAELQERVAAFDPVEKGKYSQESLKLEVESWGVSLSQAQKVAVMNAIGPSLSDLKGKINLRDPQQIYWVIVAWPYEYPVAHLSSWIFFGREVAVNTSRGPTLAKYDLRRRRYLGPTSMDTELAFLMSNMCQVRNASLVIDPFVGTGGLLVPAAHQGAITMGMDIDIRVIKNGKVLKSSDGVGERRVNVWTNFEDYDLDPPVGLLRADLHRNPFRTNMQDVFDAVVADPPYGVRAGGRKSNSSLPDIDIRDRATHIASTSPYPLGDCLHDLLDWSARMLVPGGRLAYWTPSLPEDDTSTGGQMQASSELPRHPNLCLKYNCEQILGGRYNRRLIVMEKIKNKPYDSEEVVKFYVENPPVEMAIDHLWDVVYAPHDKTVKKERKKTFRGKNV
jgi:tRNA (guanine10-N2)-methyltransferase